MQPDYEKKEIETLIQKIVHKTMTMDLTWDWPCGVAYYGIGRAYKVTQEKEYLTLLKDRIDELIELGLPETWTVNACAMGHCLIDLYEATQEEKYWNIVMSKVQYLKEDAPRFGERVLQHTVSAGNDFPEQCWADTLFMGALFMLRAGVLVHDQELIEDALNQYDWHIKYLLDRETGLFYHGYNNITQDHMSGFYWGRANAWAAFTMAQVGDILPECYLYPKYMNIVGALNEHLSAVKLLQTEKGLWRTILDDCAAYEEISASAGLAAAMVLRGNVLYTKYINKAWRGIIENVGENGRVYCVSAGTAIMKDREGYCNISKDWMQGWGQGLVLAFLAELLRSEDMHKDGAL